MTENKQFVCIAKRMPIIMVLIWCQVTDVAAQEIVKIGPVREYNPPVTVADSVRMSKFAARDYLGSAQYNATEFSPDGNRFVIILQKGNLAANTTDFSLLLYST